MPDVSQQQQQFKPFIVSDRPWLYEDTCTVGSDVIDGFGHVNNEAWLAMVNGLANRHSLAMGFDFSTMLDGIGAWFIRKTTIEYIASAFEGDILRGRTWVRTLGATRSHREYQFFNHVTGSLCVQATTEWIFVNTKGKPIRIPKFIREAYCIAPEETTTNA